MKRRWNSRLIVLMNIGINKFDIYTTYTCVSV